MPTFKPPVGSRQKNAKGDMEISYVFQIVYGNEDGIAIISESSDISTEQVKTAIDENTTWWQGFIQDFLKQSGKFFSKQYTVQDICKIIQHSVIKQEKAVDVPCTVTLLPKHIRITGSIFMIYWSCTCEPISIDIPGLSDPLPDLNKLTVCDGEVSELNMDEIPINSTESLELDNPAKLYEKQKVKEAILKARVAYYRAQHQIRTFSDKYGDDYSDSEFELEDTENESEEEDDQ